ncbi:hypothetical protein JCM10213_005206 [Rhodosporidiobolus nylandii]
MSSDFQLPPTRITDPSFLEGLKVVLESYYARNAPQEEIQAVVSRAETFFLSSRADLDLEAPQPLSSLTSVPSASSSSSTAPPTSATGDAPPYPPSFAELAQLIASGAPIPGIRDIPDALSQEEPSEAKLAKEGARKPWEKMVEGETAGEVGTETRPGGGEEGEMSMEEEVKAEQQRRE